MRFSLTILFIYCNQLQLCFFNRMGGGVGVWGVKAVLNADKCNNLSQIKDAHHCCNPRFSGIPSIELHSVSRDRDVTRGSVGQNVPGCTGLEVKHSRGQDASAEQ